jgi:hypothetical protein
VRTALDVHPRKIMALLGHTTQQQSFDYAKPTLDSLHTVMDDLDAVLTVGE